MELGFCSGTFREWWGGDSVIWAKLSHIWAWNGPFWRIRNKTGNGCRGLSMAWGLSMFHFLGRMHWPITLISKVMKSKAPFSSGWGNLWLLQGFQCLRISLLLHRLSGQTAGLLGAVKAPASPVMAWAVWTERMTQKLRKTKYFMREK